MSGRLYLGVPTQGRFGSFRQSGRAGRAPQFPRLFIELCFLISAGSVCVFASLRVICVVLHASCAPRSFHVQVFLKFTPQLFPFIVFLVRSAYGRPFPCCLGVHSTGHGIWSHIAQHVVLTRSITWACTFTIMCLPRASQIRSGAWALTNRLLSASSGMASHVILQFSFQRLGALACSRSLKCSSSGQHSRQCLSWS